MKKEIRYREKAIVAKSRTIETGERAKEEVGQSLDACKKDLQEQEMRNEDLTALVEDKD